MYYKQNQTSMKKIFIAIAVVAVVAVTYFLYANSQNINVEKNDKGSIDFLQEKDSSMKESSEKMKQNYPESKLDVGAILKQTSDLALITSALYSYKRSNNGTYPNTLKDLVPEYTPALMFPQGQIPLDYNAVPFDYRVGDNNLSYELCHSDLEKGGIDCIKSSTR